MRGVSALAAHFLNAVLGWKRDPSLRCAPFRMTALVTVADPIILTALVILSGAKDLLLQSMYANSFELNRTRHKEASASWSGDGAGSDVSPDCSSSGNAN